MNFVYLDYNATTPIDPEVAEAMRPYLEGRFGNASSSHRYGIEAKQAVEAARGQVAELLGCAPDEILWTSGGTESNNLAVVGVARAARSRGDHIVTTTIEHPAVLEVCRHLEREGYRLTWLPVDHAGLVDPGELEKAIEPGTILVSVMHANNEVGSIQPIRELAAIARRHDVLFHTDAAQSVGKIPTRVDELGVDLLAVAGHKLYAPQGTGALYVRRGVRLARQIHGADHERRLRAGTESVMLVVGLGAAARIARRDLEREAQRQRALRDRLHRGLREGWSGLGLHGHSDSTLPNTLSVSFAGIEAATLLAELEGVAASAGAACHAELEEPSHVLRAMGVAPDEAAGTVRLSVGRMTTEQEVDRAVELIVDAARRLSPGGRVQAPREGSSTAPRLTRTTRALGCGCKIPARALQKLLERWPAPEDPDALVGSATADDAAVYRIDERTAIVQTLDFLTPVVDDPFDFGAIAAANALSDVYAMGGRPRFALNIVCFPITRLPFDVLRRILEGAREVAREAGVSILGGHSVDDTEPKFGLAVTGTVDPRRILTNAGARAGDALLLTKPLGSGVLATGIKQGLVRGSAAGRVVAVMRALNERAALLAADHPVHACTDVTGFGLLGHLLEMARASGADAEIEAAQVPLIEGAQELAAAEVVPGGTLENLSYFEGSVSWDPAVSRAQRLLLCDAQTSGGLLFSLPQAAAEHLRKQLHGAGVPDARIIGRFLGAGGGRILVRP